MIRAFPEHRKQNPSRNKTLKVGIESLDCIEARLKHAHPCKPSFRRSFFASVRVAQRLQRAIFAPRIMVVLCLRLMGAPSMIFLGIVAVALVAAIIGIRNVVRRDDVLYGGFVGAASRRLQ